MIIDHRAAYDRNSKSRDTNQPLPLHSLYLKLPSERVSFYYIADSPTFYLPLWTQQTPAESQLALDGQRFFYYFYLIAAFNRAPCQLLRSQLKAEGVTILLMVNAFNINRAAAVEQKRWQCNNYLNSKCDKLTLLKVLQSIQYSLVSIYLQI